MKDYKTENILILNCSLDMAKSIVLFRNELSNRSPIEIPNNWPSNRFKSFLPLLIEDIEKKKTSAFYMWILAELLEKKMMGDILLYKKNNQITTACLEMYFLSPTYEKKYFKESLILFLDFVMNYFEGEFSQISMEILYSDNFRMSILKKEGFTLKKQQHPYLIWSLSLPTKKE